MTQGSGANRSNPLFPNPTQFGYNDARPETQPTSVQSIEPATYMQYLALQISQADEAARLAEINGIVPANQPRQIGINQLRSWAGYQGKEPVVSTFRQSAELLYKGPQTSQEISTAQVYSTVKDQILQPEDKHSEKKAELRRNIAQMTRSRKTAERQEEPPSNHIREVTERVRVDATLQNAINPHRILDQIIRLGKYLRPNEATVAMWADDRRKKAKEAQSRPAMPKGKKASGFGAKDVQKGFSAEQSGSSMSTMMKTNAG